MLPTLLPILSHLQKIESPLGNLSTSLCDPLPGHPRYDILLLVFAPLLMLAKIVVCLAFASEFFVIFINAYPQVLSTSSTASELSSSLCPRTPDTVALLSLPLSFWIAALVTLACALVRLWCFHTMGNFFLYEVAVLRSHKLVTTGPYSIVRHPGYTSAILSVLGVMVMHLSYGGWNRECGIMSTSIRFGVWWFFSVGTMSLISLWRRCGFEDVMLRQKFREEWEEWRKDVPYRICPGVY